MKKADFIKKVLKSKDNTVFVTEGQVENALAVFTKLGMKPPTMSLKDKILKEYADYLEDDGYHGVVCKYSWQTYQRQVPKGLLPYLKEENMGDYTMVMLDYSKLEQNAWTEEA